MTQIAFRVDIEASATVTKAAPSNTEPAPGGEEEVTQ